MTEQQWLNSDDPRAMIDCLMRRNPDSGTTAGEKMGYRTSDRKLRLWAEAVRESIEPGGRWSNRLESDEEIHRACYDLSHSASSAGLAKFPLRLRAALLREIVGNPFRLAVLPADPRCRVCDGAKSFLLGSGEDAERIPCRCSPWITPQVLSLAKAAYNERKFNPCPCSFAHLPHDFCDGSPAESRISDGTLDNFRLALLADALEEAGCPAEEAADCPRCKGAGRLPDGKKILTRVADARNEPHIEQYLMAVKAGIVDTTTCGCNGGKVATPNPLLAHLRSPDPHYRGCWALDLILGKS